MKIDLAKKPEELPQSAVVEKVDKPYYPTVYVSDVDADEELPVGQKVKLEGVVVQCSETERQGQKKRYSFEIEIHSAESDGKSEPKKKNQSESYDDDREAVEKGLEETSKRLKEKKNDKNSKEDY